MRETVVECSYPQHRDVPEHVQSDARVSRENATITFVYLRRCSSAFVMLREALFDQPFLRIVEGFVDLQSKGGRQTLD